MTDPRFSVLIPAYRGAETIRRAAASALGQTYPPLEVIVCDDGSPDDIAGALDGLPVQLVRQTNQGVNAARNAAARQAQGDWLVLLDQDDEWLPGRLEAMRDAIDTGGSEVGLVTTDAWVFEADGTRHTYYVRPTPPPDEHRRCILEWNFIYASTAIRRDVWADIGTFNEETGSEYEAWVRAILAGWRAVVLEAPLAIYHRSHMQKSRDKAWIYRGVSATIRWALAEGGLSEEEAEIARKRLREIEGDLALALALAALRDRAPGRRALALGAAADPTVVPRMRVRLLAAAAAPGLAARRLPRRTGWYG